MMSLSLRDELNEVGVLLGFTKAAATQNEALKQIAYQTDPRW
jgi:hypothetical protein